MPDQPFLGEVFLFAGTFAPVGYAFCDGQLMSIAQNTALFSLLGTTYGGDGKSTFALPDFRGRAPMDAGAGPGLTARSLGETSGASRVTLLSTEVPSHAHDVYAVDEAGDKASPVNATWARDAAGQALLYSDATPDATMADVALAPGGEGQAHDNMQPFLAVHFIIAVQGVFPARP